MDRASSLPVETWNSLEKLRILDLSGFKLEKLREYFHFSHIFSRVLSDSTPRFVRPSVARSVGLSVGRSVTFYFLCF